MQFSFMRASAIAFLLFTCTRTIAGQESHPESLSRIGSDLPFWVSAVSATARGEMRWDALPAVSQRALRQQMETHRGHDIADDQPCTNSTFRSELPNGDTHSVGALITSAPAVYQARILSVTDGFDGSIPSELLAASITDPLRVAPGFPDSGVIYVIYWKADFKIGRTRFCNAGPNPDYTPHIGDDLLIFAYDAPSDQTGRFLLTTSAQLIFSHSGALYPSAHFRSDPVLVRAPTIGQLKREIATLRRDK